MRRRRRRSQGLNLQQSGPWIAIGGLAILLWLAISTSIYAPWWGVMLHVLVLVPMSAWVARWIPTRPKRSAFVPVAGLPMLAAITFLGVWLGNWQA